MEKLYIGLNDYIALETMGATIINDFIIESQEHSGLQNFFDKHGIKPEKIDPSHNVCSIGFSEKEQRWYGWSHRAICGFGIGAKSKPGLVGYGELKSQGGPYEAKTLDDCKKMAIAFAKDIA